MDGDWQVWCNSWHWRWSISSSCHWRATSASCSLSWSARTWSSSWWAYDRLASSCWTFNICCCATCCWASKSVTTLPFVPALHPMHHHSALLFLLQSWFCADELCIELPMLSISKDIRICSWSRHWNLCLCIMPLPTIGTDPLAQHQWLKTWLMCLPCPLNLMVFNNISEKTWIKANWYCESENLNDCWSHVQHQLQHSQDPNKESHMAQPLDATQAKYLNYLKFMVGKFRHLFPWPILLWWIGHEKMQ